MADSDIDVCSSALIELGEAPIQSFDDDSDAAEICSVKYPPFKRSMLTIHPWHFTSHKRQLAKIANPTDLIGYEFSFVLPSDRLNAPDAVYINTIGTLLKDYEIVGDRLNCNYGEIWILYHRDLVESKWPPVFETFFVAAFAANIGMAITEKDQLVRDKKKEAWGNEETMSGGFYAAAKRVDSQRAPVRSLLEDGGPLIGARFAGTRGGVLLVE